jgi:ABC-type lipoprotein release transport system permease subunit
MITAIAWRNIWRNRLRSGIVIAAIATGLFGGIFSIAFMEGVAEQTVNSAIALQLSHIQLHHPLFLENEELKYRIPGADSILHRIAGTPEVAAASRRYRVRAMASTASGGTGVEIVGIDPSAEKRVTDVWQRITDGDYFAGNRRNPLVVGERLAKKLRVKVGHKIVLTTQAEDGTLTGGAFKVIGLFKSDNSAFDETRLFADSRDISRLLGMPQDESHEIALLLANPQRLTPVAESLASEYPFLKIETWRQIAPDLGMLQGLMQQMMFMFIVIILIALAFGIINTMLMAVIERTQEIGLLMALGMSKTRIFIMIMLETVFLSLTGGFLGMAVSIVVIHVAHLHGIDLSIVGKGLAAIGYAAHVYPRLAAGFFAILTLLVIVTAILSSLYPARKALKLKPAEAIRVE